MPRPRKLRSLRRVAAYVDEPFFELMERAMSKLGLETKAEFVRIALKEKIDRMLKAVKEEREEISRATSLFLPLPFSLAPEALLAVFAILAVAILCFYVVRLVRAESPEEQARAQRVLAGCIIAGAIMAIAKPVAYWATGIRYDEATGTWYVGNKPADLPPELISMMDRLLMLLQVIGVIVVIAGLIYGGIQLARVEKRRS